jgi:hypothetical protein
LCFGAKKDSSIPFTATNVAMTPKRVLDQDQPLLLRHQGGGLGLGDGHAIPGMLCDPKDALRSRNTALQKIHCVSHSDNVFNTRIQ